MSAFRDIKLILLGCLVLLCNASITSGRVSNRRWFICLRKQNRAHNLAAQNSSQRKSNKNSVASFHDDLMKILKEKT
jgi:hypothetical protein